METILSNIKERVLQIAENKGIAKEKFFQQIGVTYGNFKGIAKEKALSSDTLATIVSIYPDINPNWLLTGKGDMFIIQQVALDERSERLRNLKFIPKVGFTSEAIPLVSPKAIGGFGNNEFSISDRDVKDYYIIPKFKHKQIDFMIEVEGSSMYPKYNSGDVVACKIINEDGFIQWNKTHVVATKDQGIIIKRIKKGSSDSSFCMISDNESYDPFEVPKDEITGIALVVGVIRLE